MLNKEQTTLIDQSLTRIFALPITRSTYREIQNAILRSLDGSREKTQFILEMLFKGNVVDDPVLKEIVQHYSVKTRLARDVMERGDFISLLTSDITKANDKALLINRIRRVDGDEFQFLTDSDNTLNILEHFIGRLQEIKNQDPSFSKNYKNRLKQLSDELKTLL
jgi:hypothetical protein